MLALQAHRKFTIAAESFGGFAALLAPVVFGAAEERSLLPHLEHVRLVRLLWILLLLQLSLSLYLLRSPSELPLGEVRFARGRVPLLEDVLREVPLEASSLIAFFPFYFLPATLLPLSLVAAMATHIIGL